MAKVGFEISLGLTGAMTLWLGIMKIGEKGGIVNIFYRLTGPLLKKLFPSLPPDSPAYGPMIMNVSANMMDGEKELAIKNYAKSVELNPKNTNAIIMLERINKTK